MSWQTFKDWMMFTELEPLERDTYQSAYIASILTNMHRDTTKHPQPYPISDFVLKFDPGETPPAPQQTPEYIEMVLLAWMDGHNAMMKEKGQL